jgi:hypothetical protein
VEPLHERHLRLRGDGDVHAAAEAILTLLQPNAMPAPSYHSAIWAGMTGAGG